MSLSKGYPFSLGEKLSYYSGRVFCFGAYLIGVDLYSKCLPKQQHFPDKIIKNSDTDVLSNLNTQSKNNRKWHFKNIVVGAFVVLPCTGLLYRIGLFKSYPKQSYFFIATSGLFFINSVYAIMAHTYNSIRINQHLKFLKYGKIESLVDEGLAKDKCTWFMYEQQDGNDTTHVICNSYYYDKLYFYFEEKEVAQKVLEFLSTLPATKIDLLNMNSAMIRKLQIELLFGYTPRKPLPTYTENV